MANQIANLADIIRTHSAANPDDVMITLGDQDFTWSGVHARSAQVAHALTAAGVGAADRVAFLDKNSVEYFEVLFATSFTRSVAVAINWRLAGPEMAYIVNDAQAKVLIIHAEFAEQLEVMRPLLEHTETIVVMGEASIDGTVAYEEWIGGQSTKDPGGSGGPDDVALQLYTSGTTGHPKGAQLTNHNFTALIDAVSSWSMSEDSVNLVAMPLFHIGGSGWALFGMSMGARSLVVRDLDVMTLLNTLADQGVTHAFLVPAALQFLLLIPSDEIDLSKMELMAYGASPITEEVLVGSMAQFGCDFIQVYGLTETTGAVTQLFPEDHDPGGPKAHLLRSAGQPLPGVELKIIDDDGSPLPDGEVGEVWIHSPANMIGYWNLPEATAEALPGEGWFCSGDAGYIEDGYLFIHDRVKDMIISGGENVYPAEVENCLMSHDAVADVAVIGVPDDKWGETAKALVILAEDAEAGEATEKAIIEYSHSQLAKFKCPTTVEFITEIPRNPSGKILKRILREPYWADSDRNV